MWLSNFHQTFIPTYKESKSRKVFNIILLMNKNLIAAVPSLISFKNLQ